MHLLLEEIIIRMEYTRNAEKVLLLLESSKLKTFVNLLVVFEFSLLAGSISDVVPHLLKKSFHLWLK